MEDQPTAKDIFYREAIYPDPIGLISWAPRTLDEVKDTACVVLDTNALLVPYATGRSSLEEIAKTYRTLVSAKRLVVPGQVIREFATNRVSKLQELYQQMSRKKNLAITRERYPLLESVNEYLGMTELEDKIDGLIVTYRQAVDGLLSHIRNWYWNDPVTLLYQSLFAEGVVHDPQLDKVKIGEDLAKRVEHKIPPGYKDSAKDDGGVGDVLIWHTILDVGKERKLPVIFVSDDQKADWWLRSEGISLYPRFELVDEYRRNSDGQSFHIMIFSKFLEIMGASKTLVEEVRKEEQELSAKAADWRSKAHHTRVPAATLAAVDWLRQKYGERIKESRSAFFDYEVISEANTTLGVVLKYDAGNLQYLEYLRNVVGKYTRRLANVMSTKASVSGAIVVVIAAAPHVATGVANAARALAPSPYMTVVVGFVNAEGKFQVIFPSQSSGHRP
jgi:rRNA-processing protein FCF1